MIATCEAAPKDDAIYAFVGSIIRSFDNQNDFPDPSEFQEPFPPKGGYLTQFEFDVTEDGVPELFLSSSLFDGYRAQKTFSIYEIKNGAFVELASDLQINSSFGVIKNEDALSIVSLTGTTRWGQTLFRQSYHFKKSGYFTRNEIKINADEYQKLTQQVDQSLNNGAGNLNELLLGTKDIIAIKRAKQLLLASYISDPSSQWSPMHHVEGYGLLLERSIYSADSNGRSYKDPMLEDDRIRASTFDLKTARAWLKKTNSSSTRKPRSTALDGATASNTFRAQTHSSDSDSHPSKAPNPKWPWITAAVALLLSAFAILKRRS